MSESKADENLNEKYTLFQPTPKQSATINKIIYDYTKARNTQQKGYNQFNGRNLYDCIDDWTKRWNGYVPEASPLLDITQSRIFLNYTRNTIISYLSQAAQSPTKPKIIAINKKTNIDNKKFAELVDDLRDYSEINENGDSKFLETALEATTKGTAVIYEGYMKVEQELDLPVSFDATTGELKTKKEKKVIYDDCYREIVPIEDFFIANAYEPNIQKQPFIIWRKMTTHSEAKEEFGHYKNFDSVKPGSYAIAGDPSTFYRNQLSTDLGINGVEILKYYNRMKNQHTILINGIPVFDGAIPFKDGHYPFAKYIYEPFGNDFFWGAGFPNKIQGEQDLKNMMFNMMVDKTSGSLLPFGLTSDLDDLIEDDTLELNKIRKVGDINKWRFEQMPGVLSSEVTMLQLINKELADNSGDISGGGNSSSPRGGKLPARQILLQKQQAMQRMGFSLGFLEDGERDRTELRISHILQFYSIPKIESITGKGKDIQKIMYRDVVLSNKKLSDGKMGNKIIKLVNKPTKAERAKLSDQLSVTETMGEEKGIPTEAVAMDVSMFWDYNLDVQVIKNSSYEKNQALDQASRMEFANWRFGLAQVAPLNAPELIKWVEESYDIDNDRFEAQPGQQQPGQQPQQSGQPQQGQPANPQAQGNRPASELNRTEPISK